MTDLATHRQAASDGETASIRPFSRDSTVFFQDGFVCAGYFIVRQLNRVQYNQQARRQTENTVSVAYSTLSSGAVLEVLNSPRAGVHVTDATTSC